MQDIERVQSRRWVSLEGAFNFRDLGGYRTADGGWVRWESVFRSDALHHLSAADARALESLGIARIIDLRSPEEIAALGRGPLAESPIEYVTASVLSSLSGEALGAPPGDDIAVRYLWYLDIGREAVVAAFEAVAGVEQGAVVFHCAAGKDRTGVLAALLLSVLGVDKVDIAADYALSNQAMSAILERLSRDPLHAESVAQMPANRKIVQSQTMARFLELLDQTHGGAQAWLEAAGASQSSIAALRTRLGGPSNETEGESSA